MTPKDLTTFRLDSMDKTLERIEAKIDCLDERFASKNVERLVYGLVALILTSVVGALIALVLK